jgi:glycogen synthase
MDMKILMLGWELPPHNSGSLGVACYQLSKELANQGSVIEFVVPYTATHADCEFMTIHGPRSSNPTIDQVV